MTPEQKKRATNLLALRHAERGTDLARYQQGVIALLQELVDAPDVSTLRDEQIRLIATHAGMEYVCDGVWRASPDSLLNFVARAAYRLEKKEEARKGLLVQLTLENERLTEQVSALQSAGVPDGFRELLTDLLDWDGGYGSKGYHASKARNARMMLFAMLDAHEAPAVQADLLDAELVNRVVEAIAPLLDDAYDCTRVWDAWCYGTMSADDFDNVADQPDRLEEIARAAIDAAIAAEKGNKNG